MMDREQSYREHQHRRRLAGEIKPNKRQRQEAERRPERAEVCEFEFLWSETEVWHTHAGTHRVREMEDGHLWQTVIWCVRNAAELHIKSGQQGEVLVVPGLVVSRWLAEQPIFRALVREAVRRDFTYPGDVFTFLRAYLLHDEGALRDYQPWHDPEEAQQAAELEPLEDLPLRPPEWDIGKPLRAIEIDDDDT